MIPLSLAQIADIAGGEVHDADPQLVVTGAAFLDSRTPIPGGLFVATAGEHADGHSYADAAVRAGAAAVLGERPTGAPSVVVDDSRTALQALAHHVLDRLRDHGDLAVVAITGSQGKTSVKDLLGAVLGEQAPTVSTHGSFNNEWGLPLTVLRADASTRFLVLEMGARGVGHIATLCAIARPDVAMVLNVGTAHLGEFGSRAAIARAKGEIVEALDQSGVAVLNADDDLVAAMATRTTARVRRFGTGPDADVRLGDVQLDEQGRARFRLSTHESTVPVQLRLVGAHQALNAAATAAAATSLGLQLQDVAASLGRIEHTSPWRMELSDLPQGMLLINDSYNANPESMRAAIDAAVTIAARRGTRVIAALGEMRELGEASVAAHAGIGRYAVERGVAHIIAVGPDAEAIATGAGEEAADSAPATSVPDRASALASLRTHLRPGDVVLIKASRGARLELLAAALMEEVDR